MGPSIVIPLVILPILIAAAFIWYRRSISELQPDETRTVSGVRLTAEALHRIPSPPWRIVYEISGALGDIDHVLVGPVGVVAITTVVADRPRPAQLLASVAEAQLVSEAAVARGPVDEMLRVVGIACNQSATIFWGSPGTDRAAADDLVHGSQLVEGQRIGDWVTDLASRTASPLDQTAIDLAWRTIAMGIGRPDPLA